MLILLLKPSCIYLKASTETAVSILNDVLMFERIEGGELNLEKKCRFLGKDVFRNTFTSFKLLAKNKDVVLHYVGFSEEDMKVVDDPEMSCCWVMDVDKFRINQVLRNYVSNAIKFSPNNGTVTLKLSISKQHGHDKEDADLFNRPGQSSELIVEISDEGIRSKCIYQMNVVCKQLFARIVNC